MLMATSSYAIPDVTPPAIALRHGAVLFHISVDVASGSRRAQNLSGSAVTRVVSEPATRAALLPLTGRLKLRVFRFCLPQNWNIRVCIFPER